MANREMRFDIFKQPRLTPIIYGRVGDGSVQKVTVYLTANDEPIDLTGYIITFEGNSSGNKTVIMDSDGVSNVNAEAGSFDYTFPNKAFGVPGEYERAYFSITHPDTKQRSTTSNFQIIVMEKADITVSEAETIITEYNRLIEKLNDAFNNAVNEYDRIAQEHLDDMQTQLNQLESQLSSLNVTYNSLTQKANEIRAAIEELGNLKVRYSNSIDFGRYDYSGNPNLMLNLDFSKLSGSSTSITTPSSYVTNKGDYFEIDTTNIASTASVIVYIPNIPRLLTGQRYNFSAEMRCAEGNATNIKIRPVFLNENNVVTAMFDTIANDITNVWTRYNVASPVVTAAQEASATQAIQIYLPPSSTRGKIQIKYNIKVEKGLTTSPFQPNILEEPWQFSKSKVNEDISNQGVFFPITSSNYLIYNSKNIKPYEAGKTYTLTIKGTKLSTQKFSVFIDAGNIGVGALTPVEGLANVWSRTFTITQAHIDTGVVDILRIYQTPDATKGAARIDWLKLEEGSIFTPDIKSRYAYQGIGFQDSSSPKDYVWNLSREYLENHVQNYPMTMDDGDAVPLANIEGEKASFADLKIHKKYILLSQAEAQAMTDYNTLPSTLRTPSGDASQISGYIVHNVPDVSPDRTIQFVYAMAYSATNLRIAFRRLYGGSATGWNETFRRADFDNLTIMWQKAKLTNDDGNAFLLSEVTSAKASLADLRLRKGYVYLTTSEMQAMTDYANIPELMKSNTVGYILQNTPDIDTGSSVQVLYTNTINDTFQQRMAFRRVSPNIAKSWVEVADMASLKDALNRIVVLEEKLYPYEGHFYLGTNHTSNMPNKGRMGWGNEIGTIGQRLGVKMKPCPLDFNSGRWNQTFNRDATLLVEVTAKANGLSATTGSYIYLCAWKDVDQTIQWRESLGIGINGSTWQYRNSINHTFLINGKKGDNLSLGWEMASGKYVQGQLINVHVTEIDEPTLPEINEEV